MKSTPKLFRNQTLARASLFHRHYPEKYACGILLCLLPFISLSVLAADSEAFSDGHLPDKLQNAAFHTQQDIWRSGVGEGFCAGTQVMGLTSGAAYGQLMFGSNERHHLALISVSYSQIIGGVKGLDKWYQCNWELRAELFGGAQFNSATLALIGLTPHLRYNFATGTHFVPYIDAGAGVSLTEIRTPDLGGAFQFNLQAITGVNYFVKDDLSINIAMQYLHLSSSAISMPNMA